MPTTLATQPVEPQAEAMRTAPSKNTAESSSSPPHCLGCMARNTSASASRPIMSREIMPGRSTSAARSRIAGSSASIRGRKPLGRWRWPGGIPERRTWRSPRMLFRGPPRLRRRHSTRRPRSCRPPHRGLRGTGSDYTRSGRARQYHHAAWASRLASTAGERAHLGSTELCHPMPMRGTPAPGALASFGQRSGTSASPHCRRSLVGRALGPPRTLYWAKPPVVRPHRCHTTGRRPQRLREELMAHTLREDRDLNSSQELFDDLTGSRLDSGRQFHGSRTCSSCFSASALRA